MFHVRLLIYIDLLKLKAYKLIENSDGFLFKRGQLVFIRFWKVPMEAAVLFAGSRLLLPKSVRTWVCSSHVIVHQFIDK